MTGAAPVLLVTGASSGIGRAVAHRASARGAHLVLVARDEVALKETADECLRVGAAGVTVEPTDIGDDGAVAGVVRRVLEDQGRLDAVVNAAGVVAYGDLPAVPVEVFDRVLRTNLLGAANVARHVLPVFRAQERGHLVLTGSVLGHLAAPGMTAYIVSKWAVRSLARQLSLENRDLAHVHVSHLAPGGVDTPIYETAANYLGLRGRPPFPVSSPEHVAAVALRLLDRPRDRAQVGAANGVMRLGFTLLPGVFDALVGPLLGVAALDRTTRPDPGPGRVLESEPAGHSLHGTQSGPLVAIARNVGVLVRGGR